VFEAQSEFYVQGDYPHEDEALQVVQTSLAQVFDAQSVLEEHVCPSQSLVELQRWHTSLKQVDVAQSVS
jgi:hypothetical protein